MAITAIKIHPAIGIARVGNSPDEFFIAPERLWEAQAPQGGFKDAACRVKRQAARFRLFAYDSSGSVSELTEADAEITWTVHLVNRKAVERNPTLPAGDMTIDPGSRTITGPDQRAVFDTGVITFSGAAARNVPLGEIRTDVDGRLLVLGGFGSSASPTNVSLTTFADNAGWHDDTSDGPVSAHVKLTDGTEFDALGAWAIVAPPKFAPELDNVITLYDAIFEMGVGQGWHATPANPSYTNDIYPILQRARTIRFVTAVPAVHSWVDPVYTTTVRQSIFNRIANPSGGGGDMPRLSDATLTPTQYAVMQAWRDGTFAQDWTGEPQPAPTVTPGDLDRAALSAAVGAAFYPGIEAGGISSKPIVDPTHFLGAGEPLRLDHAALQPGDVTQFMAVPWQADFFACAGTWWPVPRPLTVMTGPGVREAWDRDVASSLEMVNEWSTLGFVVRQGDQFVEVDQCQHPYIELLTAHLVFADVPQGPAGMSRKTARAVVFEVRSPGGAVTLSIPAGQGPAHPRLTLPVTSITVGPTVGSSVATARLWLIYETGTLGETINDQLTVTEAASGRTWAVSITANTVARQTSAVALVLDRSGSMSEDRGDGQSKYLSLIDAASVLVDVMVEGDGIGLVSFSDTATALQSVTTLGRADDPFETARQATKDVVDGPGLTPSGSTSIGEGLFAGRALLNAATGYDLSSLVLLTDGVENRPRWIADVAAQINARTYAIGLGRPENTSAPALQTVSGNSGGSVLITGAISGDNRFILQKYFLQILAGISNAEIVLDPDGLLMPKQTQRIPFRLSDADAGVDVILLTDAPQAVDFRIQTPSGPIIEPARAIADPAMSWILTGGLQYYRLVLPTEFYTNRFDQAGVWHALIELGKPQVEPTVVGPSVLLRESAPGLHDDLRRIAPLSRQSRGIAGATAQTEAGQYAASLRGAGGRGLPFSFVVHAYSSVSFRAALRQDRFGPGATITIDGSLTEAGAPARAGATSWAEVSGPDGITRTVAFAESEPGEFSASFVASRPGVYRCRVRVSGRTHRGYAFAREQTQTGIVWIGGDEPGQGGRGRGNEPGAEICRLLQCLISEGGVLESGFGRHLEAAGLDLERLRSCFAGLCQHGKSPTEDG
jgi:L-Lysine epsilon oxidase N-terminal/L-lysine epsilon oxidase C-terminal domain/von Willebrand factor type A domain